MTNSRNKMQKFIDKWSEETEKVQLVINIEKYVLCMPFLFFCLLGTELIPEYFFQVEMQLKWILYRNKQLYK